MHCPIEKQLSLMGADAKFSDDGLLSLSFNADDEQEFIVVMHKDTTEMKLRICLESYQPIPLKAVSRDIFMQFAQQALDPLRDGCGIGLYPGTENISTWKVVDLSKPIELKPIFDELVSCLQKWDTILAEQGDATATLPPVKHEQKVFNNLI